MDADIKAEWIADLRSGQYEQGRSALRRDNRYCCLGVLCEVAVRHGVIPQPTPSTEYDADEIAYGIEGDRSSGVLPQVVAQWAGMPLVPGAEEWNGGPYADPNPSAGPEEDVRSLASLNDTGVSFDRIADFIGEYM